MQKRPISLTPLKLIPFEIERSTNPASVADLQTIQKGRDLRAERAFERAFSSSSIPHISSAFLIYFEKRNKIPACLYRYYTNIYTSLYVGEDFRKGGIFKLPEKFKLEQEVKRLRAINQLLYATRDSQNILEILTAVRDQIHPLVTFDRIGFLIAEPKGKYCIVHELVTKNGLPCSSPGDIMPIEHTAIEWSFREQRTHINQNLAAKHEFLEDPFLFEQSIQSIIRIPLFKSGHVFGIMTIKSTKKNHFSKENIALLEDVAIHLSSSLYISKLVMDLKLQATTDGLTGVFNRHALRMIHNRESLITFMDTFVIEHQFHQIDTAAVLMIDIDDFKLYNDTYGHDQGDQRLVALTQILRYATPGHQLIFRYGGDEFVILLPNVTQLEAHNIATKIHQSTLKLGDHRGEAVSVSIGVTCAPWEELASLVHLADQAMYVQKKRRHTVTSELEFS